ncbi:hypothetical protein [Streptomyces sp. CHB9.2]|uniref:hypothetical protein n=1 Tax=Streptomyces sp. CHB9.2 TaxID=2841670 RepID=UPI0020954CED|nr:hypothetical protein [Streptomyces sp. CHB9.2]MCO6704787.1 hypothetical protein [Streptomyces sp. CHB9.2]
MARATRKRLIRQPGAVHDSFQDAQDTLAGALAVPNIEFGYVTPDNRPVFFADCGEQANIPELGQHALDCVIGQFHHQQWPERIIGVEVAKRTAQHGDTLLYMSESPYFLFGFHHPTKADISVMYVIHEHEIGGITREWRDVDL